jgi:endoglucanase
MPRFVFAIAANGLTAIIVALVAALLTAALLAKTRTPNSASQAIVGGVNFAGAEFNSGRIPGIHGKHYIYPDAKTVAPFRSSGMAAARLPVRWERLQPVSPGPLDAAEAKHLDAAIKTLGGFSIIIIDIHNYARFRNLRLDQDPNGEAKLVDLWSKLAKRYRRNSAVAFGLMNEPHGISAKDWRLLAEAATEAKVPPTLF